MSDSDDFQEWFDNSKYVMAKRSTIQAMHDAWQAARAQGGDAPSLYGLSAFEVKAIAQELHRAACEHSDGDDDYPLDVQIIAGVENDDGTVTQGPILCIRDSDYPEEGVYPIPVSQEVRDRYTHPSASDELELERDVFRAQAMEYKAAYQAEREKSFAASVPERHLKALRTAMHHWMKDGVHSDDEEDATFCDEVLQELLIIPTPAATPQPADNWLKCSERLPTEADEDCEGKIWCGYRDKITKKVAGPWRKSVNDFLVLANQYPGSNYWQRTGLKRPNPPAEQEGE